MAGEEQLANLVVDIKLNSNIAQKVNDEAKRITDTLGIVSVGIKAFESFSAGSFKSIASFALNTLGEDAFKRLTERIFPVQKEIDSLALAMQNLYVRPRRGMKDLITSISSIGNLIVQGNYAGALRNFATDLGYYFTLADGNIRKLGFSLLESGRQLESAYEGSSAFGKSLAQLGKRINQVSYDTRIQKIAFDEQERAEQKAVRIAIEHTSAVKSLVTSYYELEQRYKQLEERGEDKGPEAVEIKENLKELERKIKGHARVVEELVDRNRSLFSRMGVRELVIDFDDLLKTAAVADKTLDSLYVGLEIKTNMQKKVITRIISAISTLNNELRHASAYFMSTGKISEQRLQLAEVAARNLVTVVSDFGKIGGELPVDLKRSIEESIALLGTFKTTAAAYQKEQETLATRRHGIIDAERAALRNLAGAHGEVVESTMRAVQTVEEQAGTLQKSTQGFSRQLMAIPRKIGNAFRSSLGIVSSGFRKTGELFSSFSTALGFSADSVFSVFSRFGGLLGNLNSDLGYLSQTGLNVFGLLTQAISSFTSFAGDSFSKLQNTIFVLNGALMALSSISGGLMLKAGMLAVEYKTLDVTMRQVARNIATEVGIGGKEYVDYIVNLRNQLVKTGITTIEATDALTQFMRAKLPTRRLMELAEAAKNLGVTVSTMTTSEVFERFIRVVQTGNSALLDALGISLNVSNFYEEKARELGKKSAATLTITERQEAIIDGLIKQAKMVTGVYDEAMTTAGKQLSSMKRYIQESFLAVGKFLEPAIAKIVFSLNKLFKSFIALPESVHKAIAGFIKFATVAPMILTVIGLIIRFKSTFFGFFTSMVGWLSSLKGYFAVLVILIGLLNGLAGILRKAYQKDLYGFATALKSLLGGLGKVLAPLIDDVRYWINTIIALVRQIGLELENVGVDFLRFLVPILNGILPVVKYLVDTVKNTLNGLFMAVYKLVGAALSFIRGDVARGGDLIVSAIEDIITTIIYLVQKTIGKAAVWGWNLIVNFANGITEAATKVLAKVMTFLGNVIGRFIKPGSPPEAGPLRYIVEWGKGLINTFLLSFKQADFGILKDVMSRIGDALKDAATAGTIDEKAVIPLTKEARVLVAEIISNFRKTGQVSAEQLDRLKNMLGAGSEEYVKYLKLTLEHQAAVERLKRIQEEVNLAEKAGFVSKELQERLKAAEEDVKAKEEAVNWQREYLEAMKDTVNLELEQLKALREIADKISGAAQSAKDIDSGFDLSPEKFIPAIDKMEAAFEGIREDLGLVSEEWLEIRKKVDEVVTKIKEFLGLPLDEKIRRIKEWISELPGKANEFVKNLTGIDLGKLFENIGKFVVGKGEALDKWLKQVTGYSFSEWVERAKEKVGEGWTWIVGKTENLYNSLLGPEGTLTKIKKYFDDLDFKKIFDEYTEDVSGLWDTLFGTGEGKTSALSDLKADLEEIKALFGEMKISEGLLATLDKIKNKLEEIKDKIKETFGGDLYIDEFLKPLGMKEGASTLDSFLAPLASLVGLVEKLSGLIDTFSPIIDFVFLRVSELKDTFTFDFGPLSESLSSLKTSWEELKTTLEPLRPLLSFLWKMFGKFVGFYVITQLILAIVGPIVLLTSVFKGLSVAVQGAIDLFAGIIGTISFVISLFSGTVKLLTSIFDLIYRVVTGKSSEEIKQKLDEISERFGTVKESFLGFIDSVRNVVNAIFKIGVGSVVVFLSSIIFRIIEFGARLGEKLGLLKENTSEKVREFLATIEQKIKDFFDDFIGNINEKLSLIWVLVLLLLSRIILKVTEWGARLVEKVKDKLDEIGQKFLDAKENIADIWDKTWALLIGKLDEFKNGLFTKFEEAKSTVAEFVGSLFESGVSFVDNFWKGIESSWESLKAKIKEKLGELRALLPFSEPKDKSSPLYGLSESGAAIVKNISDGFGTFSLADAISGQLELARNQLRLAEEKQITYNTYNILRGAFENAFPGVKNAQDAHGVMDVLNLELQRAKARAAVGA